MESSIPLDAFIMLLCELNQVTLFVLTMTLLKIEVTLDLKNEFPFLIKTWGD